MNEIISTLVVCATIINSLWLFFLWLDKADKSDICASRIRIEDLYKGLELLETYLNIELDDGTKHYPKYVKRGK